MNANEDPATGDPAIGWAPRSCPCSRACRICSKAHGIAVTRLIQVRLPGIPLPLCRGVKWFVFSYLYIATPYRNPMKTNELTRKIVINKGLWAFWASFAALPGPGGDIGLGSAWNDCAPKTGN
jgi:hypothetical protein